MPFLAPERALAVAIMSYNGQVIIGLMGDYDAMADLDAFGEDVEGSVAELLELSNERTAAATPAGSSSSHRSVTRSTRVAGELRVRRRACGRRSNAARVRWNS